MPDREKVIKGLKYCTHTDGAECHNCPYYPDDDCVEALNSDVLALLKEQVEIVRCKDCKHGDPCNGGEIYCEKDIGTFETAVHKPDWYCADGERRRTDEV